MVQLQEMQNMFWALVLEEGKRYSQTVEQSFHISMAALELPTDSEALKGKHHQTVSVMVASQKSEFLICSLNFKHVNQQPLDLNFNEGEEVTFFINGQGTVHLTGYQLEDDKDFGDLDDLDMEEDESDNEVPELVSSKKRKKAEEAEVPKKKTKWLTPGGTEFSDESDDDSDDDDDESEDEMNYTDLLNMEAAASDDDDEDFDLDDNDDETDESDDEDISDEEVEQIKKTPKQDGKKGQQTPKQEKKKEKQTPKPEQSKTPKQAGTPKPDQSKTPKQDKKQQGQLAETPVSKLGAGGDAESEQSGKKKKRKKRKKNKNVENGGDHTQQDAKTPQQNTPKPGQNTPKPGQNTPKPGQNTPNPGQNTPKPGQNTPKPGQNTPKPGQNTPKPGQTPKKQVLAGGIIAEEIKVGDGPPAKKGKMTHVYYVGKLQKDGKQFDSCKSGKPFRFKLGMGEVIQGWDKGVEGMKVGGKRRLTVPPQQGYGNQKQGPIPPNSTLVFEVELKNVS